MNQRFAVPALVQVRAAFENRPTFALSKTFAALRHRNYRLFFAGQLTSLTGTWMQNVAQSWLVYELTQSPLYLGIVSFASALPTLLFSLGAGVLVDRVPKRRLLLTTQTWAMLLAFILAADVFSGFVQAWHIVILSFLLGTVNAFDAPARQAFTVEMVEREDLMNAIALNSSIFNGARVIGPTLAGITLAALGPAWCFFLNGVSFIAVIVGLALMRVKPFVPEAHQHSAFAQLREGLGYIWHTQNVRTLIAMVAVSSVFGVGYMALLPAFARDILHQGATGLGLMSASVGTGALTGALVLASLGNYRRKGMLLTAGNLLLPLMVLLFAFSRVFPLSLLILVAAGWSFMVQNATANTLIQTTVPDRLRGRVMSVHTLAFMGLFPLGSLLAGTVAERFGVPIGAMFGGTIALALGLFWLWRAPYVRKLT